MEAAAAPLHKRLKRPSATCGQVLHGLDTMRRALAVQLPPMRCDKFHVGADMVVELPEATIESAIQAAVSSGGDDVPCRSLLEQELLSRGNSLATLRCKSTKHGGKYKAEKVDNTSRRERPLRCKPAEAELALSFVVDDGQPGCAKSSKTNAIFQVTTSDTLQVLAELVHHTCGSVLHTPSGFHQSRSTFSFSRDLRATFADVALEVGRRYVYRHGACAHYLTLSHASLWTKAIAPDRCLRRGTRVAPAPRVYACDICAAFTASTVVCDDPRTPSPVLFCDQCLHMLYYGTDNLLLPEIAELADPTKRTPPLTMRPLFPTTDEASRSKFPGSEERY